MNAVTAPQNVTLDQSRAIGPQVHSILRQQIIHGLLPPGARLSESECAASFATSRQPVREAFIKLSEEGLVEVRPQRGTLVRRISQEAVLEARFVREAIEADVVRRVTELGDPAVLRELQRQLQRQNQVTAGNPGDFMALDERFHRTLAEAAGIGQAWKIVEGIKAQMDRVRFLSFDQVHLGKLIAQHTAIVDGIARGDTRRAEAAIRAHLHEILHDLPQIRAAHPDLFEPISPITDSP
ncbi:GntR family transcriptional regulator [uncultured Castellaniella sp.]|uniref:GntR family transcriptional regulator n=1 Tax=uncultured Castellaniella sp. TaxID=647907 RepID=UPI00262D06D9|nr:GntR family transcriptional regulator [uncultured Castellaniella sp.]